METKHTPGPWAYATAQDGWRFNIHQADGAPYTPGYSDVAWSMNTVSGEAKDVQEANARLIAAAPELLEALEALVRHDSAADSREGLPACIELDSARDAIAKARGAS